jgi:hypothetical protein
MQDLQRALGLNDYDRRREELRQRLAELATQEKAIQGATSRVDQERQAGQDGEAQQRELEQLAKKQTDVDRSAQGVEPKLPTKVFQDAMRRAREAMQRSEKGLQQRDSGTDTRDSQQRAVRILDQMARALDEENGGDQQDGQQGGQQGQQQQQGQQMSPEEEEELRNRLSDLRLLRGMEQALREETQELERQRAQGRELTPGQQQRLRELTERQRTARAMTEDAARALGRFPRLSGRVGEAGEAMREAEGRLGQSQTGEPTQEAEARAILRLSDAIRQAQQQAQQMAQGRQQGRQRGNRGQQQRPGNNNNGNRPAVESLARRGGAAGGRLNLVGPGQRGFGPLDAHDQSALREGWRERIPTDYADLIQRYYRSLAEERQQAP